MKILFVMPHPGSARNFESTLQMLAERDHELKLAFERLGPRRGRSIVERLASDFSRVSLGKVPSGNGDRWAALTRALRLGIDYLRYLDARYAGAPALRERVRNRVPAALVKFACLPLVRGRRGIGLLSRLLKAVERRMPVPAEVEAFLAGHRPDVVLITPLVDLGSAQADYLRAAKRLGIPACLCVHSWDNLTNKGLLRDVPDAVAVWNEAQLRELVELHGVPTERMAVTGAHSYDHWFEWTPRRSRSEFCTEIRLPPERPYLLYVCSSKFIAPNEVSFVRRWIAALRESGDQALAEAGVLVRPHPQNPAQWREEELDDGQVVVWPRHGANPMDERDKIDYFESIHYSAGVVGINTSALIESAIVGRKVHTVLVDEFEDTQMGTLHFHLLVEADGGLLRTARSLEEHAAHLAETLAAGPGSREQNRDFLSRFVRPHGLEEPATPRAVHAIEAAAAARSDPVRDPIGAGALRLLLLPLARVAEVQHRKARERKRAAAHGPATERRSSATPDAPASPRRKEGIAAAPAPTSPRAR